MVSAVEQTIATQDPLTGLANRQALLAIFEDAFLVAVREERELCCVVVDIDHFSQVNDILGHAAGDEVICAVANTLTLTCQEYDTVSRYGGVEYVVLLPDRSLTKAIAIAERFREAIIAMGKDPLVPVDQLSASIGVAALEPSIKSPMELIARAGQAVKAAKAAGNNQVMLFDSTVARFESVTANDLSIPPKQIPTERETLLRRVDAVIQRSHKHGRMVGLLSIEFKDLNRIIASMGHNVAATLVADLECRFEECLTKLDKVAELSQSCKLARIAPNEYGVLLVDLDDVGSAMSVTTGLRRLLVEPSVVGGQKIHVGANLGVAIFPEAGGSGVDLLDSASRARAKAGAKPEKVAINFYSQSSEQASRDYIQLESDLFEVFDHNQLDVHFQPFYDLQNRRISALEALIRWEHPTRGGINPEDFIGIAEANGLIHRITVLVMERAVALLDEYRKLGLEDIRISVNISPLQLREPTLVAYLLGTMSRAGLSTNLLEVEITESAVIDSPQRAKVVLDRLRDAGIRLAMDDFGTGYSSLALLADLALDSVKIDRSFVEAMSNNERSRSVVESIIKMAHALNLNVIGEGVETNDQLAILKEFGCQEVQGFLIARPMPAEQALQFLQQQSFMQKRSSS